MMLLLMMMRALSKTELIFGRVGVSVLATTKTTFMLAARFVMPSRVVP